MLSWWGYFTRVQRLKFFLTLLGLAGVLAGCARKDNPAAAKGRPPPLVAVARVEARDVPVEVQAPVDLRPLSQADIGAKTIGYLDAVLVDRGDVVKLGQTVALVRPSDLPDQLAAARGAQAQAQAQTALARLNLERAQKLAQEGLTTQAELQGTSAALAIAEAMERSARAQIGALGTRLGETRLLASMDGVVAARRLDPGALVGPTTGPVLTLQRVDQLRVFVAVTEREAGGLAVGMQARVQVDALPGQSFEGQVVRIAPAFDTASRTLDAEVHLPNPRLELRPGMYGRAFLRLAVHPQAAVIPATAVQVSNRQSYVFVIDGDKARRQPIRPGVDGGTWVEVLEGLKPGEDVVVAGADGLAPGTKVRTARGIDPYTGQGSK
ncbi:MAG: efflux RND transporter periplasmic adaptor subunit [Polyangiaceae bacterium]|nr:efflux RND transporter periplasmic adaptor subunit [Polyangiaceae bacterium]